MHNFLKKGPPQFFPEFRVHGVWFDVMLGMVVLAILTNCLLFMLFWLYIGDLNSGDLVVGGFKVVVFGFGYLLLLVTMLWFYFTELATARSERLRLQEAGKGKAGLFRDTIGWYSGTATLCIMDTIEECKFGLYRQVALTLKQKLSYMKYIFSH